MQHDFKVTTTISLSENVVKQAKSLGIPISSTVERVLRLLISLHGATNEEIELASLMLLKEKWEVELASYEGQLEPLRRRIAAINAKIEEQRKIVEEIKRSEQIATLMRLLNEKIRIAEFDLQRVKDLCKEELTSLQGFGINTTDEWIQRQIERIARFSS